MQRTRRTNFRSYRGLAPWIVAGAMLVATGTAATAQDATPPPEGTGLEIVAEDSGEAVPAEAVVEAPVADDDAAADDAVAPTDDAEVVADDATAQVADGGGDDVVAIPATGAGLPSGLDLFTVGATVSAAAAGVAAFRARRAIR